MTTTNTATDVAVAAAVIVAVAVAAAPSNEQQRQQQREREREHTAEATTSSTSISALRAHAPAFVPSFAVLGGGAPAADDDDDDDVDAADNHHSRRNNNPRDVSVPTSVSVSREGHGRSRKKRNSKRNQQRRPEPNNETDASVSRTPKPEHDAPNACTKSTNNRNRRKNEEKPGGGPPQSQSQSNKDRRTGRQRQRQRRKPRSPTRTAAGGSDGGATPSDNNNNNNNNNNPFVHNDTSSAAFPALVAATPAASSVSQTTWKAFPGINDQRGDGSEDDPPSNTGELGNWQNGLDRLGASSNDTGYDRTRRRRSRRSEFSAWDENDDEATGDGKTKDVANDSSTTTNENAPNGGLGTEETMRATVDTEAPNSGASWKRSFDMHRLRDRWWMAVAKQQERLVRQQTARASEDEHEHHHQLHSTGTDGEDCNDQSEISNYHYGMNGNDNDNDDSDSDSDSDSGSSSSSSSNIDPDHDGVRLSALDRHVQNNTSLRETGTSKKELIDSIVEHNDDRALREMLELSYTPVEHRYGQRDTVVPIRSLGATAPDANEAEHAEDVIEYAMEAVIRRNKTGLLRTILSITKGRIPIDSQPLIQAAKLGREECASILLSKQDGDPTILFLKDDADGNTALHCSCGESGEKEMVLVLLKQVVGNTKGKRQQLAKLVTARNKQMQTPLHLACESGRNDLVEVFLTTCKSSLLFKILSMEDIKHQTPLLTAVGSNSFDAVVSLLMWRGNHDHQRQKQPEGYSVPTNGYIGTNTKKIEKGTSHTKAKNSTCPLVWAAKSGNLDMIDLLIQFGDQSGNAYRVTEALFVLLRSDAPTKAKVKGSDLLLLAGANPFEEVNSNNNNNNNTASGNKETALGVAAKLVPCEIIRSIVSTAMRMVSDRQLARRRDPVLQQQPEAFFRTLEAKENSEANSAKTNALIETLFRANSSQQAVDFHAAVTLYEQIEKVEDTYLARLQVSILKGAMRQNPPESRNWCLLATYQHSASGLAADKRPKASLLECDRSVFAEKSLRLLELPWVKRDRHRTKCVCPWMKRDANKRNRQLVNDTKGHEMKLVASDASEFCVDVSIVSEKSGKLASAYRFAEMNRDKDSEEEFISIEVGIPPDFCKLFIQHMYHGSICFGWPNLNDADMCNYLLELMLVAEEFLVPSLVKEIEMRLMSSKPKSCFCWDCCQALRVVSSETGPIIAECLYLVDANSSMVTKNSAADILGVTEYMVGLDYNICLAPMIHNACIEPRKLWTNYEKGLENSKKDCWKVNKATVSLRDIAVVTILKNFGSVVEDPDVFLANEETLDIQSQKQLLLQMCLEELKCNSVVAAGYQT
eukprot:jgi/Psemu1/23444/gm1.23444_g